VNVKKNPLDEIARIFADSEALLVITGAGISVESGLPTFLGNDGLYGKSPNLTKVLSSEGLFSNPNAVWNFINNFRLQAVTASPNQAHRILARWESTRRFRRFLIATQNIDGLHQKAGSNRVSELHGSVWQIACPRELDYTAGDVFAQEFQKIMAEDPNRETILRRWREQNQREVCEDRDVPFRTIPPYWDPQTRPNVLLFDEEYGNRLLWVRDFIRQKPDVVFVIGCSGTLNILWQLLGECQQANPRCQIINLNMDQHMEILNAINLHMSATDAMRQLDEALCSIYPDHPAITNMVPDSE
jgi:NAD-dependent SIR2 family protein deacetylase